MSSDDSRLIGLTPAVPLATDLAIGRRLSVVNSMFDWLQLSQIREDVLQVVIIEISKVPPRHGCVELTRSDMPCPHRSDEQGFIVVRDPRGMRGKVRSRYPTLSIGEVPPCVLPFAVREAVG